MKNGQFNQPIGGIQRDLEQGGTNYDVLVVARDRRGGEPKIWGTGSEQDATELLRQVAPEFSGLQHA